MTIMHPGDLSPVSPLVERFDELSRCVAACKRCPSMEGRRRVLSHLNGPLEPVALCVAEAPGRLGADRTGIPLAEDRSGKNFQRLLDAAGVNRRDLFVTNAVLCNPRDTRGRNRSPSDSEINQCSDHLVAQLDLVWAPVIVTLGATALRALERIMPHGLALREAVGRPVPWRERILIPLYHPGAQAMLHRPFEQQIDDYVQLGRYLRELKHQPAGASAFG